MIVKKCEEKNCKKAGTYKCPKDRFLKNYWHFCKEHAGNYNKKWNYYAGMTEEEIEREWEKQTFGTKNSEYPSFIFEREKTQKKSIPQNILESFAVLGLKNTDNWNNIQRKYLSLAKSAHPDTGKSSDSSKFVKISSAYQTLKKYFNK